MWVYVYLLYFWFFPFCYFGMVQYMIGLRVAFFCPFFLALALLLPLLPPFPLPSQQHAYHTSPLPPSKTPFTPSRPVHVLPYLPGSLR